MVVSYLFPISNHNVRFSLVVQPEVVSYLFPISNHNLSTITSYISGVFQYYLPQEVA